MFDPMAEVLRQQHEAEMPRLARLASEGRVSARRGS